MTKKNNNEVLWREFASRCKINAQQLEQFKLFYELVVEHNELFNLTTITELRASLAYHFEDSLALREHVDLNACAGLADVGTGAGFPGIPLKIMYPKLPMVLIEVTHKKIEFLKMVCDRLGLENVEIYPLDWRTFLRTTDYKIDLFCARASLQPLELLRMFRTTCSYKDASLVYWAAEDWQPEVKEVAFVQKEYCYSVGRKRRKLVVFGTSD